MDYKEYKAKNVEDAITQASIDLGADSSEIEYEVVEKGSAGFLGIGSKPAIIKARLKKDIVRDTKSYLTKLFAAMEIETVIDIKYDKDTETMSIDLSGPDMGVLIGKRGQTLDSLQYLISLFVNKKSDSYIRVKLDTENYRERRKETLENLAKNIAFKVKKSRKDFVLEPMNPFERRIIHSTLQNDKYVATKSEGEEPYRRVIIYLKKGNKKDYKKDYKYSKNYNSEAKTSTADSSEE